MLSGGPGWGAELSRRTLSLSPRWCAEQGACGDHFLQGKRWGRRPAHGTGGQGPPPPCQPWPHCYFFQLKKENISSSSSSLHSALGGQRAEDRRSGWGTPCALAQPRRRGKAQGPLSLGGPGRWTPGCRGKDLPHLGTMSSSPSTLVSISVSQTLDSSYHLDYDPICL